MSIQDLMSKDHKICDEYFSMAEALVDAGDWSAAAEHTSTFIAAMENHFQLEEMELFAEFERVSGNSQGPTSVMRYEHEQMRGLFQAMQEGLNEQEREHYLGATDTLLILMQQHNAKEEQILYPMMDALIAESGIAMITLWMQQDH